MQRFSKHKIFRDPVHGYIEVPSDICEKFIDTPIFQRLRHIQQTGMGGLFPAANHNRFTHSLGVFHLGKLAFKHFLDNVCQKKIPPDCGEQLKKLKNTFLIACLMHDCGHAPFSHIFESQYDKREDSKPSTLDSILLELIDDAQFKEDFPDCHPAPHEKLSAILLLMYFQKECCDYGADPFLASRMILGCTYHRIQHDQDKLKNSLISLLNSHSIDVDKLDYILRDTWSSGVSNQTIDVPRLLSSLTISTSEATKYQLAFAKTSLSVIRSVIDGRNFLYKWIYSHHKVIYESALLKAAISELSHVLYRDNPDEFTSKVFSIDAFVKPVDLEDNNKVFLVTDCDLVHLLKKYSDTVPSAGRLLKRDHHKSLWKTYEEFDTIFQYIDEEHRHTIRGHAKEYFYRDLAELAKQSVSESDVLILEVKPSLVEIKEQQLLIELEDKYLSYYEVFKSEYDRSKNTPPEFFFTYYPKDIKIDRRHLTEKLRSYR